MSLLNQQADRNEGIQKYFLGRINGFVSFRSGKF